MGIGMAAIVSQKDAAAVGKQLRARVIGRIEQGKRAVTLSEAQRSLKPSSLKSERVVIATGSLAT